MMEVQSKNSQVYEQLKKCVVADFCYPCHFNDFDEVSYLVQRTEDKISMSFRCFNYENIFKINGKAMLEKYYSDLTVDSPEEKYDLTLSIGLNHFPIFQQDQKTLSRDQQRTLKKESLDLMRDIATRLSNFKSYFFSAPFELIIQDYKEKKNKCISYQVSPQFKVWLIGLADKVMIYFGLGFSEKTEHQLAKIILQEMEEARRQVNNSPSIHMMHNQKVPDGLLEKFKSAKEDLVTHNLNNGILEMSLFDQHLNNEHTAQLIDYLQSFKVYLHYHMSIIKTYLHGRLRKKCTALITQIDNSKIEDDFTLQ